MPIYSKVNVWSDRMMEDKVIITGSGKCGTTFLMELLSTLGLGTGYAPGWQAIKEQKETRYIDLEWPVRGKYARKRMPYIIKGPMLCDDLLERAERWDWNIEHVYVLLRNWEDVAQNDYERYLRMIAIDPSRRWDMSKQKHMKWAKCEAASKIGNLMVQVVSKELPYTFMMFPRIVTDPTYLYGKLEFVLKGMSYDAFLEGFNAVADVSKVHWGEV